MAQMVMFSLGTTSHRLCLNSLGRRGASVILTTCNAGRDGALLSTADSLFALRRDYTCTGPVLGVRKAAFAGSSKFKSPKSRPTDQLDASGARHGDFTCRITTLDPTKLVREAYVKNTAELGRRPFYSIRSANPDVDRRLSLPEDHTRVFLHPLTGRMQWDRTVSVQPRQHLTLVQVSGIADHLLPEDENGSTHADRPLCGSNDRY